MKGKSVKEERVRDYEYESVAGRPYVCACEDTAARRWDKERTKEKERKEKKRKKKEKRKGRQG
jgi:hypothetical protein